MLLGLVGENTTLDGFKATEGLALLNVILDSFGTSGFDIPYYKEFQFTMLSNEGTYKVAPQINQTLAPSNEILNNKLVTLVTVTINDGGQITPIRIGDINMIQGVGRNLATTGRPRIVALTRWLNDGTMPVPYSRLTFWPNPDIAYVCNIRAKAYIDNVELHDEVNFIPPSMALYLSWELASQLVHYYESANWGPDKQAKLMEMKKQYQRGGDNDMTIQSSGMLSGTGYYDIGVV